MTGSAGTAVPKDDRDEDSGLHDIRNLAAASRSRMSSRRIGTNPPPVDEDILASTSGSWKSIALPEPAKMVSLPEISELPAAVDVKAQLKAEKAAAKAEAKARKSRPSGQIETAPVAAAPVVEVVTNAKVIEAPLQLDDIPSISSGTAKGATTAAVGTAKGATVTPMIGSRIAQANSKKSKAPLIAFAGIGLAAAAGVAVYLGTRGGDDKTSVASNPALVDTAAKAPEPAKPAAAPVVEPIKEEPKEDPKPADVAKEPDPVPVEPPTNAKTVKPAKPTVGKKPVKATIEVDDPGNGVKAPVKKEEPKKEPPKEGDPDFEQLLKESGYTKKDADKPKLEKKSLSGGDFKTGMAGVAGKAQGCYKGTQGTAMVKLTIAPNGSVSKVAVTGVGAAEAACVQAAVRGASFPAWDGGPQSFNYSYLLSE